MVSGDDTASIFAGRYRLVELVGEGADARVYAAEDRTLRRRVAVKILREDLAGDEAFLQRFGQEMRAASALNSPRVLPVHDWGTDPVPYLVTERVTGGSLAARLAGGHRLTPSQALVIGLEVARALSRIHGAGRAHLGLTPSSILFDSQSRLFISDLGLAPALAQATAPDPAGGGGPDAGAAPSYTAEEQSQDVCDLALIMNEAVTGSRQVDPSGSDAPFDFGTDLGPLLAIIKDATAQDPADRLDASTLAQELLRVAGLLPRPEPLPPVAADATADPGAGSLRRGGDADPDNRLGPPVAARSAVPLDDAPRRRWPGIALAVVLVLAGTGAGLRVWLESRPDTDPVPELRGRSRSAAADAAADLGWEVVEVLVREPGTARGEVVGTEPAAGAQLGAGELLEVFVSLGEPLVALDDDLFGYTVADATETLADRGLAVDGETPVNDEVVPPGLVVGLDVEDGVYELEVGSEVVLLVSTGPADRTVPEVPEGGEPAAAIEALLGVRLVPLEVQEPSDDVAEDSVIGFRPASGQPVSADTIVEMVVSSGPPEAEEEAEEVGGPGVEGAAEPG